MNAIENAYDKAVQQGDIEADTSQLDVVRAFDGLLEKLSQQKPSWQWWRKKPQIKGIYIYGPVGVGKTYLMDMFFQHVPQGMGLRFHFHHFMQQVDQQLRKRQGQSDPLRRLAEDLARKAKVLCFDEFMVHDVAHAMILAELFTELFHQGLVLVATSNTLPDHLYPNGLQRQRFLPAIELVKQQCHVLTLVARRDYRLNRELLPAAWFTPADKSSEALMREQFEHMGSICAAKRIEILGREVECVALSFEGVWFDFEQICTMPRSQLDYLELANRFLQIYVSNIPILDSKRTAQAVLFVYFIDIMYDHGVRLVVSSQVDVEAICQNQEMQQEFQRTVSRLKEMQSIDYAKRHQHRALQSM
jgi:cell division protein ZapE